MIHGVDVSNLQGFIDWRLVASSGWQFAMMKASEGTDYHDTFFSNNWAQAKQNGMARGAYHFGRPSESSGKAEADYFLSIVGNLLEPGDVLALDLEDSRVSANADLLAYTLDFLRTVAKAVGFNPMIYTGYYYTTPHNLNHADLSPYGLWLAAYQSATPKIPYPWPFWAIWQYDAQSMVPGIGRCDVDIFNGTLELFRRYGKPA